MERLVCDRAADFLADAPLLAFLGEMLHQQSDRQAALHLELRVEAFLCLLQDFGRQVGGDDLDAPAGQARGVVLQHHRSEEHTSELQSLMRISYAVFCLKKKITKSTK